MIFLVVIFENSIFKKNTMSRAKLIDHYLEKSLEEGFEIDQIRKELEANDVEDEEIRVIVRIVDADIQKRALVKTSNQKSSAFIYIGLAFILVSVVVTIGTYTGLIDTGNSFVILYGPFFTGVSILLAALAKKK